MTVQRPIAILLASLSVSPVVGTRINHKALMEQVQQKSRGLTAQAADAAELVEDSANASEVSGPLHDFYPSPVTPAVRKLDDPFNPLGVAAWNYQVHECTQYKKAATRRACGGRACDVIFVGDSITEALNGMWCFQKDLQIEHRTAFLEHFRYAGNSHILAGAGDQTPNTLYTWQETVSEIRVAPKAFFLMIGTNNIGFNFSSAENTAAGILAVASAIRTAFPESPLILHPLTPRADDMQRPDILAHWYQVPNLPWQTTLDATNALVKAEVEALGDDGIFWMDCNHVFPRGKGQDAKALMPDLLHPNAKGYAAWFKCLNPKFESFLEE